MFDPAVRSCIDATIRYGIARRLHPWRPSRWPVGHYAAPDRDAALLEGYLDALLAERTGGLSGAGFQLAMEAVRAGVLAADDTPARRGFWAQVWGRLRGDYP